VKKKKKRTEREKRYKNRRRFIDTERKNPDK
jgi:hypothetical protein